MKKIALLSAVAAAVLLLGAWGLTYWKRLAPPAVRPDALVPGGTLLLVETVDLPRTAIRWQKTELNRLWEEPEVQAFLEKPLATMPAFQQAGQLRKDLVKLWPRQAFVAVVSMDGSTPKMLAGFSFAGNENVAEAWLAAARGKMKEAHPAGKADLILHGRIEVATYTDHEFVLAEATHAGWHLAANDLALLKGALDRLDAPKATRLAGLAQEADYQKCFAPLPADAELRVFARTGVFVNQLRGAMSAGDPTKPTGLEALGKIRAIAAVSKIEGAQFHDAIFSLSEQTEQAEPLARPALELTDPETLAFYSVPTSALDLSHLPAEMTGLVPFLSTLQTAQKATLADLPATFGPEVSFIVPKLRGTLGVVVALGVRDPQRAASLAEALTDPKLGESAWTASDEDGLRFYTAPAGSAPFSLAPVLTLTERYWLLGTSPANLARVVQRDPATPQLDHTQAWREVAGSVVPPTQSFGYVNLGSLFESYYATARMAMGLGLMGSEGLGQYVDAGKLPNGAVVARHLGATAFSQASLPGGSLWEARGNLSAGEALLGGGAAIFWTRAALPALPGAAMPAAKKETPERP
jgi:hypothetical protein